MPNCVKMNIIQFYHNINSFYFVREHITLGYNIMHYQQIGYRVAYKFYLSIIHNCTKQVFRQCLMGLWTDMRTFIYIYTHIVKYLVAWTHSCIWITSFKVILLYRFFMSNEVSMVINTTLPISDVPSSYEYFLHL